MTPPVERYCRATVEVAASRIETIVGIAMLDPAEYLDLHAASKALMLDAIAACEGSVALANPAVLAEEIQRRIEAMWPGRYWFCEVAWGERDGWVQCYQKARETAVPYCPCASLDCPVRTGVPI